MLKDPRSLAVWSNLSVHTDNDNTFFTGLYATFSSIRNKKIEYSYEINFACRKKFPKFSTSGAVSCMSIPAAAEGGVRGKFGGRGAMIGRRK